MQRKGLIDYFKRIKSNLPNVYKEVPTDKILIMNWQGHKIPVDSEYFKEILAYSEGVCETCIRDLGEE